MIALFVNSNSEVAKVERRVYDISILSEEEKAKAIMVDYIPEPEKQGGILYVNTITKELSYQYPQTPLEQEVEMLKGELTAQQGAFDDFLINVLPMLLPPM